MSHRVPDGWVASLGEVTLQKKHLNWDWNDKRCQVCEIWGKNIYNRGKVSVKAFRLEHVGRCLKDDEYGCSKRNLVWGKIWEVAGTETDRAC